MELKTLGDSRLKKMAFRHVIQSVRHHYRNGPNKSAIQNLLLKMLQQQQQDAPSLAEEELALRALLTLCELHGRCVWFDERTEDAICTASLHSAPKIMITALSFLIGYDKFENNRYFSPLYHLKRQQRLASQQSNNNYYSPLYHLKDAQGFTSIPQTSGTSYFSEVAGSQYFLAAMHQGSIRKQSLCINIGGFAKKLFTRLRICHVKKCHEPFEVTMMMMMVKVIARTIGLHRLILLSFYPFLQLYIQPHHRDITNLLAVAAQSCHDKVPPIEVEPLFKQIVNQFVHDCSRPEAIAVGLNAVREICMRMPLLMNEDLLLDLALYKKSREEVVSVAARSLIALFREVSPTLLVKKDHGRPIDPKARPVAYGEINVSTDVPRAESSLIIDNDYDRGSGESDHSVRGNSDNDQEYCRMSICIYENDDGAKDDNVISEDEYERGGSDVEDYVDDVEYDSEEADEEFDEVSEIQEDDYLHAFIDYGDLEAKIAMEDTLKKKQFADLNNRLKKKQFVDLNNRLITGDSSLRALKKLAGRIGGVKSQDEILSYADHKRIKELQKMGGLSSRQIERKKKRPLAAKRDQIVKRKKHWRSSKQFRRRKA